MRLEGWVLHLLGWNQKQHAKLTEARHVLLQPFNQCFHAFLFTPNVFGYVHGLHHKNPPFQRPCLPPPSVWINLLSSHIFPHHHYPQYYWLNYKMCVGSSVSSDLKHPAHLCVYAQWFISLVLKCAFSLQKPLALRSEGQQHIFY